MCFFRLTPIRLAKILPAHGEVKRQASARQAVVAGEQQLGRALFAAFGRISRSMCGSQPPTGGGLVWAIVLFGVRIGTAVSTESGRFRRRSWTSHR